MLGASRESMANLINALEARRSDPGIPGLAAELYQVADLLGREKSLRSALADSGQSEASRRSLAEQLFGGRVGALAVQVATDAVGRRWSEDADLVFALESLAAQAAFITAQDNGSLDRAEEEIFRFGHAVDASPELQMALTAPASSVSTKAAIVNDLLGGRTAEVTAQVISFAVGHLHGRRIDAVLADLAEAAAGQRKRIVAVVRVARPLDAEQHERLASALRRLTGREVRLNVAVDPSILGGAHVTVGNEVIDGTVLSRLDQAKRALLG